MQNYTLMQKVKGLEKLFEKGNNTEQKIKSIKWEDLKEFSPIEKSFAMDLKEAITKKRIVEFLAETDKTGGEKDNDRVL